MNASPSPQGFRITRQSSTPIVDGLIQLLILSVGNKEYLLPSLERVDLTVSQNVSDEVLLSFLQARTCSAPGAVPRLKQATFTFIGRRKEANMRLSIEPLIEKGLQIELKYDRSVSTLYSPWGGLGLTRV